MASIRRFFARSAPMPPWDNQEPVRAEIFSIERLEQHAESLAAAQVVVTDSSEGKAIAARLADNASALLSAYRSICEAVIAGRAITPAAEWLVDNYYIVEEQIRQIREDLPPSYYKELPKLAAGPFAGYPRILGLVWAFIAHTDSRFDPAMLTRYVLAYQRVQPLTIGELWAIAITFRLVLVENFRRLADRIINARVAREQADALYDRLLARPASIAESVSDSLRKFETTPMMKPFAVQLIQRLHGTDPGADEIQTWLTSRLAALGLTTEAVVAEEHQRQAAANVTVRNIVTSMRLISGVDWTLWFESVSLIDDTLKTYPLFAEMDFPTRNLYRNAIEELARHSSMSELDIVRRVVATARQTPNSTADSRPVTGWQPATDDPGFYLIGDGRAGFESSIRYRPSFARWFERYARSTGTTGYVLAILVITLLFLTGALWAVSPPSTVAFWILGLLALFPASEAAIVLLNFAISKSIGVKVLPALELRQGVPHHLKALVVVPTLLTSRDAVEQQIERLEVHYLANAAGELCFGLLTDWTDSLSEHDAADETLLIAALDGIAELNRRHPRPDGEGRFVLLHRRRVWNSGESRWMGWERKRGKLHELNMLLQGAVETTFIIIGGKLPAGIRYVITLDADTRLPRDAAQKLVGKLAHPLNRPIWDPDARRVVAGHSILQPRVTPSLPSAGESSLYQRTFSVPHGLDPYVFAVSDVYQDFFDEGSYAGKGIYDLEAFSTALAGRVPDNSLLSHDLFEGIFARAGLVTDIEVIEEFPGRYEVAAARDHRWIRGDWQLLAWLLGMRRSRHGNAADAIPALGRWKIIDNLRRSLLAPAILGSLVAGWLILPFVSAVLWTGIVSLALIVPFLLPLVEGMFARPPSTTLGSHLRSLWREAQLTIVQTAFTLTLLADKSWIAADAVLRTLYRLFVSRRHLLEWVTAAQLRASEGLSGYYRRMAGSVALAAAIGIASVVAGDGAWLLASFWVAAWLSAPAVAFWSSRTPGSAAARVSESDARGLRLIARRTWRFFETFVTAEDNMLPPDNFQEDPKSVIAHRTSPTNIGLYLLAIASAREFGWLGLHDAVDRIEQTFASLKRLERYRGHFYNWYDTRDLRPLEPNYVSTVDSGNLAGHLLALANSCRIWNEELPVSAHAIHGIADCLALMKKAYKAMPEGSRSIRAGRTQLEAGIKSFVAAMTAAKQAPPFIAVRLIELSRQAGGLIDIAEVLAQEFDESHSLEILAWARLLRQTVESHFRDATAGADAIHSLRERISLLESMARTMANEMKFDFLLDPQRNLLTIGYRASEGAADEGCYDLLASEARLASFIAIAKADVPTKHWFKLDRPVTAVHFGAALVSWSGSMFEYLMPSLVMRTPKGGILDQTARLIVQRQISYGSELGIPWGISESAFNSRDMEFTYQYSNFGVPGLGLKRGLAENVVVAPYATGLAAMVSPAAAARNFKRLAHAGALGTYGYYEAMDYTPSRVPEGKDREAVRAYMAHHQGMTVIALANVLLDDVFCTRFHSEPMIAATELLLQERSPRGVPATQAQAEELKTAATIRESLPPAVRRVRSVHTTIPVGHLLSNGQYTVMITAAGSGYTQWRGLAITRWREDPTLDDWGSYLFVRDIQTGAVWSAGYQPTAAEPDNYRTILTEDRCEIIRRDGSIKSTYQCVVTPEGAADVRRMTLTNSGRRSRELELTSYCELVLAPASADTAHPAFSKLFVITEYLPEVGVLIASRRRRSPNDPEVWVAQFMLLEGRTIGELEFETDRSVFVGRGNDLRSAAAIYDRRALSGSIGTVLDPVFALRRRIRLRAGDSAKCTVWTLAADSRDELLNLIDRHRNTAAFERAATLAWTQAQIQLRHLMISAEKASLYQTLIGHLLYANPALRASSSHLAQYPAGQAVLWSHGISGDNPIVLVRVDDIEQTALVGDLLRAREYWQTKQLVADLVILNERGASYVQDLQHALESMVRTARPLQAGQPGMREGQIFVLRADLISPHSKAALPSLARVILDGRRGTLSEQLGRIPETATASPAEVRTARLAEAPTAARRSEKLEFFNGLGGFAADGQEYVTILEAGRMTPVPWINIVCNPNFGFQATVDGGGYTWSINSRDHQMTPWSNDPVGNRPGECLYVRDEESGDLWSPTFLPVRDASASYLARFGRGYCRFECAANDIGLELLQYVPLDDSIKISRLNVRNRSTSTRRLSVTAYIEWVLGNTRAISAPHIATEIDRETGAMLVRNPWHAQFGGRVAFLDLGGTQTSWTADRREFLGRHGSLENPLALATGAALSKTVGAGLDACAALQTVLDVEPSGQADVVVLLGEAAHLADAQTMIKRYRERDLDGVFQAVTGYWNGTLETVQVKTPERSMDIMLNGWLLYQTLACRMWARSGFYQASGAYGFRDQLQDTMALMFARPEIARQHLLAAAGRQFREGDVQHWWLPTTGEGTRTRIADDAVWLAYCIAYYVRTTGDITILDEQIPYLDGRKLAPGEADAFFPPDIAADSGSLFDHAARALEHGSATGPHGLPLFGTGDWNDGMNRVGERGTGESVWLGWFRLSALKALAELAEQRGEKPLAKKWRNQRRKLRRALEEKAWDGHWYRRGFYDDGTPLGSHSADECRIDSIAQSWSVISGGADRLRAAEALNAVERYLIRWEDRTALLFTPPFDKTMHDPGYVKAYPPGIRENGGQYAHGAIWTIFAFVGMGDGERAFKLFSLLNPINHSATARGMMRYKVEPYVMAADVYSVPPHVGRGGWTWYTGSAGWLYRAGVEAILGVRREGAYLIISPSIPASWRGFEVTIQSGTTRYEIRVVMRDTSRREGRLTGGEQQLTAPARIKMSDDGAVHKFTIYVYAEEKAAHDRAVQAATA
jgi:cyclic beta-1,2-glucan synthetase